MRQRKVVAAIGILALLAGGVAWWKLRGDEPGPPAEKDPWAAATGIDEAGILAAKRAAHGDGAADLTPASAAGRITRRADGTGAAGAVVSLQPKSLGIEGMGLPGITDKLVVVVADDTGAWRAPEVVPGAYVLTATSPGLLPGIRDDVVLAAGKARTGLDLALDAGGATVRGTVTDIGGGPIADARVRARRDDLSALRGTSGGYVAITGADGTYHLTLPDGEWDAEVTQSDYTPAHRSFELAGQPITVDFRLTPGAVIRGQVIARADGRPVPGALVRATTGNTGARQRFEDRSVTAVADDAGNFTLRGLGSGAISITASARGYASAAPTSVALSIGEDKGGVKVLVDRAYTISGFVVKKGDERTGIPDVQVGAFSIGTMEGAMSTQPSGADGYFEILGVHPANYLLFAIGRDVMPDVGKPVVVKAADVTDVLIVMETGAILSGRVDPGAVAQLSLELDADKIGFGNMFDAIKAVMVGGDSDASGAFALKNAPPGEFNLVARTRDGRTGSLPVTITAADQTGLVVKLADRAAIAGRVVDTAGAPVAGLRVRARETGRGGMKLRLQDSPGAVSAGDGGFRIVGLEPGKYGVTVSDDLGPLGWADAARKAKPLEPLEVEITGADDVTGVTLTVEPRDGVIRGIVLGVDRLPAADAWVTATLMPPPIEVAGEGGKKVTITVGSSGSSVDGDGDDDDDDDDDRELRRGRVGSQDPVLTGGDGRFTITGLRRGAYQLVAEGATGAERARKPAVKTGDTVTLVLETLGSLAGTVTAGGAPVADYTISCKGPAGTDVEHVIADDGGYLFERRPAGKYTCTVTSDSGPATGEATVAGATRLDLAIGTWGSITGVVINALTGGPMPGLKLVAMGASGMPAGIEELLTGGGPTTDATGRFDVGKQTAGKGRLMIFDGGLTGINVIASKEYTLANGQRLDLGTIKGLPPRAGPAGTLGLTTTEAAGTLAVEDVVAGGPAARAGVKAGDAIVSIDDRTVVDLTAEIAAKLVAPEHVAAGQVVKLALSRGGTKIDATVTADPVPE